MPYTWYTINNNFGSNFFYIKGNSPGIDDGNSDYRIIIPPGTYTAIELIGKINNAITSGSIINGTTIPSLYNRNDVSFNNTDISIDNNNYYWKIDNRLIDFSSEIQENLLSYMILMFREIHQNIFLNDKFNKNYKLYNKGFINFEYEMLLYNLFTVFDLIKLSTLFTSFIKKYNKHKASINDYFDTFDDDLTIKDMIENKEDICIYTICRKLFYDITVKDAADEKRRWPSSGR